MLFLSPYDGPFGQLMLAVIAAIYAAGILWLRKLARFQPPERLLAAEAPAGGAMAMAAAGTGGTR